MSHPYTEVTLGIFGFPPTQVPGAYCAATLSAKISTNLFGVKLHSHLFHSKLKQILIFWMQVNNWSHSHSELTTHVAFQSSYKCSQHFSFLLSSRHHWGVTNFLLSWLLSSFSTSHHPVSCLDSLANPTWQWDLSEEWIRKGTEGSLKAPCLFCQLMVLLSNHQNFLDIAASCSQVAKAPFFSSLLLFHHRYSVSSPSVACSHQDITKWVNLCVAFQSSDVLESQILRSFFFFLISLYQSYFIWLPVCLIILRFLATLVALHFTPVSEWVSRWVIVSDCNLLA